MNYIRNTCSIVCPMVCPCFISTGDGIRAPHLRRHRQPSDGTSKGHTRPPNLNSIDTTDTLHMDIHSPSHILSSSESSSEQPIVINSKPDEPECVEPRVFIFKKYKTHYKQYYFNFCFHSTNSTDSTDSTTNIDNINSMCNIDSTYTINKIVIFDHYSSENHKFPVRGWLHHCLYCDCVTGRDVFYMTYNNYNIYIVLCDTCNIRNNNSTSFQKLYEIDSDIYEILKSLDMRDEDDD